MEDPDFWVGVKREPQEELGTKHTFNNGLVPPTVQHNHQRLFRMGNLQGRLGGRMDLPFWKHQDSSLLQRQSHLLNFHVHIPRTVDKPNRIYDPNRSLGHRLHHPILPDIWRRLTRKTQRGSKNLHSPCDEKYRFRKRMSVQRNKTRSKHSWTWTSANWTKSRGK